MHRDYIMRMIEQFMQALVSIIRSRESGQYEQAFEELQKASHRFLSTDISTFLAYTPKQLVDHFKKETYVETEEAIVCAELLNELAFLCEKQGNPEATLHLKTLALNLFTYTIPLDKQFQTQNYREKVTLLTQELKDHIIPNEVLHHLEQYQHFLQLKE